MALIDVRLPNDIVWHLVATSDDMIANHIKRFPHAMWKSSLAVFAYDPDPDTDLPDQLKLQGREITYLKVVCSITSYVPPCEECPPPPAPVTTIEDYGENQANLDAWRQKCKIISDAEHKAYGCSGALLQVAIYPKKEADETYDPDKLAYFSAFEPKKRELIEAATESGETMTMSKSDVNVRKGTTATNSTDNYDILNGVNMGGGFAGASAQIGVTGQWGTIKKSGTESVNVTNSDASRELREGSSHTANISHLYHLLNSYHLGTNRAIFFMQSRPHTLQQKDQYTFIDGPQHIEGIQEFFLVVSRPEDMEIEDYCLDALLYTAHLDDEASAKALNDPKTAETQWIEFSAIAPQIDDGGTSVWNVAGYSKQVVDDLIDQTKNILDTWIGTNLSEPVVAKTYLPKTCDGYVTPSFVTQPDYLMPTSLLTYDQLVMEQWKEYINVGSNGGWKIDRTRGIGGYDLWEDPNNSSGKPTADGTAKAPPEAFVDVVSLNTPDDLLNYLPDYGLRVRAQTWPSTEGATMYHGRIKAYFIRNDMASLRRDINMFVTVRGVSTCSDSPFFNLAPDKALLVAPDVATENRIHPRNVSPWKTNVSNEKKPNFISIQHPDEQDKQLLLSSPKGNSVPSGLDHQVLGAARAKMANMMGKQVVETMHSSLSCLAEGTDGTLSLDTYPFRQSDMFFDQVARKMMNHELNELSRQVPKEAFLAEVVVRHSRIDDLQEQIPSLAILKMNYRNHMLNLKKEDDKLKAEEKIQRSDSSARAKGISKAAETKKQNKPELTVKANKSYSVLTFADKQLKPAYKKVLMNAGFHTAMDLIGLPTSELSQILDTDEKTVRSMRLQILGIEPATTKKTDSKKANPKTKKRNGK